MTTTTVDAIVDDYLARLSAAAATLPADRRADLIEGIGEHIAAARAAGDAANEAAVRTLLDRLGEPEEIVAAARDDQDVSGAPPRWAPQPQLRPASTMHEAFAVSLLTFGSIIPVVGWLAGALLLWTSRRWHTWEKVLGTLVIPLGPGGLLLIAVAIPAQQCGSSNLIVSGDGTAPVAQDAAESCTGFAFPPAVGIPLLILGLVGPLVVAGFLYTRARDRAALEPPVPRSVTAWSGLEIAAVLLLTVGAVVLPLVGPLVGLVLAFSSDRWSGRDKAIAVGLCLVPLAPLILLTLATTLGPVEVLVGLGVLGPWAAAGYLALALRRPHPLT